MEFQLYYKILGIPETASIEQLKKAYREKVKLYHPDVSILPDAQELFISLTEAYEVLLRRLTIQMELKKSKTAQVYNPELDEIQKQWIKEQMDRIRQRAYAQSKMKFEEFKKTPTYRATKALSKLADYLIFCFGFSIIFMAFSGIYQQYRADKLDVMHVTAVLGVCIVGITIIYYSLHQIRK